MLDRLQNRAWSNRFPGSGWITSLYELSSSYGVIVSSGDIALANISSGKWSAKEVFVIQDLDSNIASELLSLGAYPFLLTCLEASIYVPFFYDNREKISEKFRFKLGFGFTEQARPNEVIDHIWFRFPAYCKTDILEIKKIDQRKQIALVASNKYRTQKIFFARPVNLMVILRTFKIWVQKLLSPSLRLALGASLHEKRLAAIAYFLGETSLDLYGSGWENLGNLPKEWAKKIAVVIRHSYLGKCDDKLEVLSEYRFCLCFENMDASGYVTEKIVDCFVAGTVPLYWGARDIKKIIPPDCFIDIRDFSSFEDLNRFLHTLSEQDILKIITAGREYLQSKDGELHEYQAFAHHIMRLAAQC